MFSKPIDPLSLKASLLTLTVDAKEQPESQTLAVTLSTESVFVLIETSVAVLELAASDILRIRQESPLLCIAIDSCYLSFPTGFAAGYTGMVNEGIQ